MNITASDKNVLIRLARQLENGSPLRRAILSALKKKSLMINREPNRLPEGLKELKKVRFYTFHFSFDRDALKYARELAKKIKFWQEAERYGSAVLSVFEEKHFFTSAKLEAYEQHAKIYFDRADELKREEALSEGFVESEKIIADAVWDINLKTGKDKSFNYIGMWGGQELNFMIAKDPRGKINLVIGPRNFSRAKDSKFQLVTEKGRSWRGEESHLTLIGSVIAPMSLETLSGIAMNLGRWRVSTYFLKGLDW